MQIAKRVYSLAQKQDDSALMKGAYRASACARYFSGDFVTARRDAMRSLEIWRSAAAQSHLEEVDPPAVACLCDQALEWHLGEIVTYEDTMALALAGICGPETVPINELARTELPQVSELSRCVAFASVRNFVPQGAFGVRVGKL